MNRILEITTGSHLYGTNTETSDKDFVGVFIADKNAYLGLESVEEIDLSTQIKDESGKNTKDAIDRKLYELRNFMKLAMQNNPNILEILFVNEPNMIFIDEYFGRHLIDNRHLFPWKGAKQKFLGYAFSQKHKMYIKRDNIAVLRQAHEFFSNEITDQLTANKLLAEYRDSGVPFIEFHTNNCSIADLNFNLKLKIKDVNEKLMNRIDKFGNRTAIIDSMGYDTKFASHLIRLMMEGKELLLTGELQFPIKDRSLLLDIRNGKYTLEEVIKMSEEFEKEIETLGIESKLPSKPRYDDINNLLISMVEKHIFK